jgi:hypothetical protein
VLAAVPPDQTKEALDIILEQGVVGAVCVLLIGALVYSAKVFQRVHADRVRDLKAMASQRQEDNVALAALAKEVQSATAQLAQEAVLSNQAVAATVTNLKEETDSLKGAIYELKEQQVRLETAINTRRGS